MRSDFALTENFADLKDKDNYDVLETSNIELRENVITAEDRAITVTHYN